MTIGQQVRNQRPRDGNTWAKKTPQNSQVTLLSSSTSTDECQQGVFIMLIGTSTASTSTTNHYIYCHTLRFDCTWEKNAQKCTCTPLEAIQASHFLRTTPPLCFPSNGTRAVALQFHFGALKIIRPMTNERMTWNGISLPQRLKKFSSHTFQTFCRLQFNRRQIGGGQSRGRFPQVDAVGCSFFFCSTY